MITVKIIITYQFRSELRRCVQLLPVALFLKTKEKIKTFKKYINIVSKYSTLRCNKY